MIDLDDKENQSPLRLGFAKSPSPKRSRTKNIAPAGQDVSDAPSEQSPSQPRTRRPLSTAQPLTL
jgi:kinetochore protein Spc7/SPC105